MRDLKSIQWFLNELPNLQSSGIIDETAAQKLRDHYRQELEANPVRNILFSTLSVLGVLLIAGGITLFTAHNWDNFGKQWRIVITFIPFALAAGFAVFTLARGRTGVWLDAAAILLMAGITTLNALISQIYHIDGSMFDFLTLNLLFALVLTYLFNSRILSLLTAVALIPFALMADRTNWTQYLPLAYTVLWIPFAFPHLRANSLLIRYAAIPACIALLCLHEASAYFLIPLAAAVFFCGGLNLRQTLKTAWFRDPWIQAAFLTMTAYLLVLSLHRHSGTFEPTPENGIVTLLFLAAFAVQLYRRVNALNLMLILFAALPFLVSRHPAWTELTATVFLIFSGAMFLIDGFRKTDLLLLNFGQLQLYSLLIVRFFDDRYSILVRSIAFLATGVVFLFLNLWLSHHFVRKGGRA